MKIILSLLGITLALLLLVFIGLYFIDPLGSREALREYKIKVAGVKEELKSYREEDFEKLISAALEAHAEWEENGKPIESYRKISEFHKDSPHIPESLKYLDPRMVSIGSNSISINLHKCFDGGTFLEIKKHEGKWVVEVSYWEWDEGTVIYEKQDQNKALGENSEPLRDSESSS